MVIQALKYLYVQADKVLGKAKNCRTLFAIHPSAAWNRDTHHPICHDEGLTLGTGGMQIKGLLVDQEQTATWDNEEIETILDWLSTFFDFNHEVISQKLPGPATKKAINTLLDRQFKMHEMFRQLEINDVVNA